MAKIGNKVNKEEQVVGEIGSFICALCGLFVSLVTFVVSVFCLLATAETTKDTMVGTEGTKNNQAVLRFSQKTTIKPIHLSVL